MGLKTTLLMNNLLIALGLLLLFLAGCVEHRTMTREEKAKAKHRAFCKYEAGLGDIVQDTPSDYAGLAAYHKCMKRRTGEKE